MTELQYDLSSRARRRKLAPGQARIEAERAFRDLQEVKECFQALLAAADDPKLEMAARLPLVEQANAALHAQVEGLVDELQSARDQIREMQTAAVAERAVQGREGTTHRQYASERQWRELAERKRKEAEAALRTCRELNAKLSKENEKLRARTRPIDQAAGESFSAIALEIGIRRYGR